MKKSKIRCILLIILSIILITSIGVTLIYSIKNKAYTQVGKIENSQSASDNAEIPATLNQVF